MFFLAFSVMIALPVSGMCYLCLAEVAWGHASHALEEFGEE